MEISCVVVYFFFCDLYKWLFSYVGKFLGFCDIVVEICDFYMIMYLFIKFSVLGKYWRLKGNLLNVYLISKVK